MLHSWQEKAEQPLGLTATCSAIFYLGIDKTLTVGILDALLKTVFARVVPDLTGSDVVPYGLFGLASYLLLLINHRSGYRTNLASLSLRSPLEKLIGGNRWNWMGAVQQKA
jgi:hypothetical protein